jgi:spore maturation protein SpmA
LLKNIMCMYILHLLVVWVVLLRVADSAGLMLEKNHG